MALFAFVDLRVGVAASGKLAGVLKVGAGERLLGRRLRGVGMWDLGRELFEIVVPDRLPADLDFTADADLGGVLDFQARGLLYGESYVDLGRRLGAYETLILHRYVDSPDAVGPTVHEPVALLMFFPAGWHHLAVSRLWRYGHSRATGRPRRQQVRRVSPPPDPVRLGPGSANLAAGDIARVVLDPAVMGGVPCIRGTRIPVVTLLGMLAEYPGPASVLNDFPELTSADLRAAVSYAAETLDRAGPRPPEEVAT